MSEKAAYFNERFDRRPERSEGSGGQVAPTPRPSGPPSPAGGRGAGGEGLLRMTETT